MTVTALALVLLALPREQPEVPARDLEVNVDPCVGVDHVAVRNLVDLELHDARTPPRPVAITVAVGCLDEVKQIRIEPWASTTSDGIRTIELVTGDAATPAAREARSRELALAIAELIRRLSIRHPLTAPRPPPPAATLAAAAPAPASPERTWLVALSSTFEAFGGGQRMAGADAVVGASLGSWLLGEFRVGARLIDGGTTAAARLTGRAGAAAVALGLHVWSQRRPVGFAVMMRGQGLAIEYDVQPAPGDASRTALLGAFSMAIEPRVLIALSSRLHLAAGAGVGIPIHGVVVRTQGVPTDSLTGVAVSATLGAFFRF